MMTLFLFGTIWFWIFTFIGIVFITVFTESPKNSISGSTISLLILLTGLYFLGNQSFFNDVFSYIYHHPFLIVLYILGYLLTGVIWSFLKWAWYLKDKKQYYIESGRSFKHNKSDFEVASNKSRIINWMVYWPFSVLWFVTNQPIRRTYDWLYKKTKRFYEKISENITKDIDFEK